MRNRLPFAYAPILCAALAGAALAGAASAGAASAGAASAGAASSGAASSGAASSGAASSGDNASPRGSVGRTIDDFRLPDVRGHEHSLADFAGKKAIVVVFVGAECPLAKLYGPRLAALDSELGGAADNAPVAFLAIGANRHDDLAELAHYARQHELSFPLLKDPGARVADLFGATRTPEAFVLDHERVVRYHGRIDDQYGVGYARDRFERRFLAEAVRAVLAGDDVAPAFTEPVGCVIGRPIEAAEDAAEVTYSKHVAPILNRRCIECHRRGEIAPFPLTSYRDVSGWEETILEVVESGRMPPWHADAASGRFSNDARLSDAEQRVLVDWVKAGAPEGDPGDMPEPPDFPQGWRIPEPDLVISMPEEFDVPAEGVVPYKYFVVDPGFTEDRWIQAAEARPGNRAVVHHLILFSVPPDARRLSSDDALARSVAAMAPGMPPTVYPEGTAKLVPAGSKLAFQMHYTPNGSPQADRSHVGVVFADPASVRQIVGVGTAIQPRLRIPPGASDHVVEAEYQFRQARTILSFLPHMHYRGKSFRFDAIYPDGRRETLLNVPRYDFNWQNSYVFAEPLALPRGTIIHCTAVFDNSGANLFNPDPTQLVTWGDQTWEEMMIGMWDYLVTDQDLTVGGPKVEKRDDGAVDLVFRFRPPSQYSDVETVHVAGTFNTWNDGQYGLAGPDDEGIYTTTVKVEPGTYEYKFVIDGQHYVTDPGNPRQKGRYYNSVVTAE